MRYGTSGREKSRVLILRTEHFIPQSVPCKSRQNLVSMILSEKSRHSALFCSLAALASPSLGHRRCGWSEVLSLSPNCFFISIWREIWGRGWTATRYRSPLKPSVLLSSAQWGYCSYICSIPESSSWKTRSVCFERKLVFDIQCRSLENLHDILTQTVFTYADQDGFPGGSDGKESACNAGDPGSVPESGRSPGEGNGNPLQYPGKSHGWRSLAGYSPQGHKGLDTTEHLHFHLHDDQDGTYPDERMSQKQKPSPLMVPSFSASKGTGAQWASGDTEQRRKTSRGSPQQPSCKCLSHTPALKRSKDWSELQSRHPALHSLCMISNPKVLFYFKPLKKMKYSWSAMLC